MSAEVIMRTFGGMTLRELTRLNIQLMVNALKVGEHVILEYEGESGPNVHYMQAMRKPDGAYQLEYRAGMPEKHYQASSVSSEQVIDAMDSWRTGDEGWKEKFEWTSIGHWFSES